MNWNGLTRHHIDLDLPLLFVKGAKGLLACGYFDIRTFDGTGEACAIVTGVTDFDEMLGAVVKRASKAALALGIEEGVTSGREALDLFR